MSRHVQSHVSHSRHRNVSRVIPAQRIGNENRQIDLCLNPNVTHASTNVPSLILVIPINRKTNARRRTKESSPHRVLLGPKAKQIIECASSRIMNMPCNRQCDWSICCVVISNDNAIRCFQPSFPAHVKRAGLKPVQKSLGAFCTVFLILARPPIAQNITKPNQISNRNRLVVKLLQEISQSGIMCSPKLEGWSLQTQKRPKHPIQAAIGIAPIAVIAKGQATEPRNHLVEEQSITSHFSCLGGVETEGFPLPFPLGLSSIVCSDVAMGD